MLTAFGIFFAHTAYHVVYGSDECGVFALSLGLELGKLDDWLSVDVLAIVACQGVHLIVVGFVDNGGCVIVYMLLCCMPFDPVGFGGVMLSVFDKGVEQFPKVSVSVEWPRFFG